MLKSIQLNELISIGKELLELNSARLNEVSFDGVNIQFLFYKNGEKYLLHFCLDLSKPFLFFAKEPETKKIKSVKKPIILFLKSHFIGKKIKTLKVFPIEGRVLKLFFEDEKEIEVRLFPKGSNLCARALGKEIWIRKPIDTKVLAPKDEGPYGLTRTNKDFLDFWNGIKTEKIKSELNPIEELKKRHKALEKVKTHRDEILKNKYQKVAEFINSNQSLDVPNEYQNFVNLDLSIYENINTLYAKAKKERDKIIGYDKRIADLEEEIQKISSGEFIFKEKSKAQNLFVETKGKGRTKNLSASVRAYLGKTGLDNLSLLRKAKPWYLWMHIKDVPGAHMILEYPRGFKIDNDTLRQASQWLINETQKEAGFYEVQYTECRFVQPIKGDKKGRVTVRNQQVLRIKI